MVHLHKFYETPSTIYLLLQYASGGRLWDYVGAYLRYAQDQAREGGPGLDDAYPVQEFQNVYTGFKVHQDNNKRESFLENQSLTSPVQNTVVSNGQILDEVRYDKDTGDVLLQLPSQNQVKDLSVDDFQLDFHDTPSPAIEDDSNNTVSTATECTDISSNTEITTPRENKVQYSRFTSFSSEENMEEDESSVVNTAQFDRQNSTGAQFQDLLQKNTKTAALENFSINSFDSAEGVVRMDSNVSDHIEVIQEVNEGMYDTEVFEHDAEKQSKTHFSDNSQITQNHQLVNNRDRLMHFKMSNGDGGLGVNSDKFTSFSIKTCEEPDIVQNDDINNLVCDNENDIIESSKELLKSVERTLSQIGTVSDSQGDTLSPSQISPSTTSNVPSHPVEPSIYDLHCDTSDSQSDTKSQSSRPNSQEISQNSYGDSYVQSKLSTSPDKKEPVSGSFLRQNSGHRSRTSSGTMLRRLTIPMLNSTDLSRSASSEQESKSPSKARQRTISHMFEQLDLSALTPDQVKIPESFIRRWAAEIIVAMATLHSLGVICRYMYLLVCIWLYSSDPDL